MSNNDDSTDDDAMAPHWSPVTQKVMSGYLDRWTRAMEVDDGQVMGMIIGELWDRLVINHDEPEIRQGLAAVGVKTIGAMQHAAHIAGKVLPANFLVLGDAFAQILLGDRITFEIQNAGGEKRRLTFENGVRTAKMMDGSPPATN